MRRLAGIVALVLLLAGAAPVLACVTGSAMGHEENACCRSMHGQCGEMAKTGCCRTEVRTDKSPQLASTSPATNVLWVCVEQLAAASFPTPASISMPPMEYSPPGLLTAKTTVLRI